MSPSATPGRATRTKLIGHQGLPEDPSSWPVAMASRVAVTPPSTEFSIGTMAASAEPSRTLSSAVFTFEDGMRMASAASGTCIRAASVKVPSGPRNV